MRKKVAVPKLTRPVPTTERARFIERCFDILGYADWQRERFSGKLEIEWTTGGLTGGSCWGTSDYSARESEPEPEFEELDRLLEGLRPEITYLQYKALYRMLVQTDSRTSNDYYGNHTSYALKTLELSALYDQFVERAWPWE
jgi:hypothetical protein